jgi:hypothetical protein
MKANLCRHLQQKVLWILHFPFSLPILILLLTFPGYSQTSRGTVSGTVLDSSGAVIIGGMVELTNPDTGVVRTTVTNNVGIYRFDAVDLGMYKLKISMQGFRTFIYEAFAAEANRTVTIDTTLQPAGVESVVEVTGGLTEASLAKDAPLRGGSLSGDELVRLPGVGTFPHYEVSFTGTVFSAFGSAQFGHNWDVSVNGSRPRGNNYMLDGADNNFVVTGSSAQQFTLVDAVQESSAQTGNFGAEFGTGGAEYLT